MPVATYNVHSGNIDDYVSGGPLQLDVSSATTVDCQNRSHVIFTNVSSAISEQTLDVSQLNAECLHLGAPYASFLPNSDVVYHINTLTNEIGHTTNSLDVASYTQFLVPLTGSFRSKLFEVPSKLLMAFRNETSSSKRLQVLRPDGVVLINRALQPGQMQVVAVDGAGNVHHSGSDQDVSLAHKVTATNLPAGALVQMQGKDTAHLLVNNTLHLFANQMVRNVQ